MRSLCKEITSAEIISSINKDKINEFLSHFLDVLMFSPVQPQRPEAFFSIIWQETATDLSNEFLCHLAENAVAQEKLSVHIYAALYNAGRSGYETTLVTRLADAEAAGAG